MKRAWTLSALLALAVCSTVGAQQLPLDCSAISQGVVEGPAAADSVEIADLDGLPVDDLRFEAPAGRWDVDDSTIATIQGAVSATAKPRTTLRLLWFEGGDRIQTDRFLLPGEDRDQICPPPGDPPPDPINDQGEPIDLRDDAEIRTQCLNLFLQWNREIASRLDHERYLAILFGADGRIIDHNKDFGVAGDLIYTAVCQEKGRAIPDLRFTKCDLQSALPKSPEGPDALVPQSGVAELIEYPIRQCFGTSVEIAIDDHDPHTIGLYERYRYTLQVGALSTDQHPHTFGLRPDGEENRIFDKGPTDDGPEYVASVVLYALPRYFQSLVRNARRGNLQGLEALANQTYHGRDVVNDHALADRIGLVVGAGLDNPRDRFVAGLSLELIPGVNLVGVYEWAKLEVLAGVNEDDVFGGAAETIPVRDDWEEKAVVFGLSLDLRYVAGLFKRGS